MVDLIPDVSGAAPSGWVCRWAAMIRPQGRVLDLACGSGRHTRYLAGLGYQVEAVDRDLRGGGDLEQLPGVSLRQADLELGQWPYRGECFSGIVVTNYLHRPLFPHLLDALGADGVLIYETFACGNERYGRPANPDFLLRPGELLEVVRGELRVVAYEDLYVTFPKPGMVQRICAIRTPRNQG